VLEFIVGSGLATAAGLNAWMPLFVLGIADRFVPAVELPAGWAWLSSDAALWIVGVLLVVEIVADKIPAVDSVNDVIQTAVRPVAGGIAFGAGSSAETVRVDDPDLFAGTAWIPIVVGVVIALAVHVAKTVSTAEDATALGLSVFAILLPLVALVIMIALVVAVALALRARRRRRRGTTTDAAPPPPPDTQSFRG
jgi:hypothetical protein